MSKSRQISYRKDIDGLRALAVLLVLVFHFDLLSLGKGGFLGVDIFFVISGFLITSIIKKQLDNDTFSFKVFYTKRIKRLAPALFAVLAAVIFVGSITLFPSEFTSLSEQLLATQFYYSNIYYWQNINYFGLNSDSVHLLHTWSLAVEEQFYLFFPVIVFFIYRYLRNYFWHFIAAGAIVSFGLNLAFVDTKPELTFYLMPTRAWQLLCGSLIVLVLDRSPVKNQRTNELLGYLGISIILLSVLLYTDEVKFPGYYALLPTIGSMLLILTGNQSRSLVSKLLNHNITVYIGQLSYSLYLVHWPINVFASDILHGEYNIFWRLSMFGLSFLCSIVLYHFIENPFRKESFFKRKKSVMAFYLTGLTVTLIIFTTIYASHGLPGRYPDDVISLAEFVNDDAPLLPECVYENQPLQEVSEFCRIGATDHNPTWILFGDSHAWSIKEAFNIWLTKNGQSGLFMFRHSCPPIKDIYLFKAKSECHDFNKATLEFIKNTASLENIILVSTWVQARDGRLTNSPNIKLDDNESVELFNTQFSKTVEYLNSLNKKIYIWEPVPGAKGNVPINLAKSKLNGNKAHNLEFTLNEYQQQFKFFFSVLNKNKETIHQVFSPANVLCSNGTCLVEIKGTPVYTDNAHLTHSLQEYWAGILEMQVQDNLKHKNKILVGQLND